MNTDTTTTAPKISLPKTRNATCKRCGKERLTWKKSKAGRWYLAEHTVFTGYTGKQFSNTRLHKCPQPQPLNTRPEPSVTVIGTPHRVIENPATHEHRFLPWRPRVGSLVDGVICLGCDVTLID